MTFLKSKAKKIHQSTDIRIWGYKALFSELQRKFLASEYTLDVVMFQHGCGTYISTQLVQMFFFPKCFQGKFDNFSLVFVLPNHSNI